MSLKKNDVIQLFGSTVCPDLQLAFIRDPLAPNHQELLLKYNIEGKSLAETVECEAINLLDYDIDIEVDCMTTCLTTEGLRFFLPLQIYFFLSLIETKADLDSYHFAPSVRYALKSKYQLDSIFAEKQLEFLADFFLLYEKECPSSTFGRRIPAFFLELMAARKGSASL